MTWNNANATSSRLRKQHGLVKKNQAMSKVLKESSVHTYRALNHTATKRRPGMKKTP